MRRRHPLPRLWLMTDERMGDALLPAIRRLPAGSGVVFRHYSLAEAERYELFRRIRRLARSRKLLLFLAQGDARRWGADGSHGRRARGLPMSAPAHNFRELRHAEAAGADLLFVSPVFSTRSHPGEATLGPRRFNLLVQATRLPMIALGGMNRRRAGLLRGYGWAAIDAFVQSRLVPQ